MSRTRMGGQIGGLEVVVDGPSSGEVVGAEVVDGWGSALAVENLKLGSNIEEEVGGPRFRGSERARRGQPGGRLEGLLMFSPD